MTGDTVDSILRRLAERHAGLSWETRPVEFAPELSDVYVSTAGGGCVILSVAPSATQTRVFVEDYVFEGIADAELESFLGSVFSDRTAPVRRGPIGGRVLVVDGDDRTWESAVT